MQNKSSRSYRLPFLTAATMTAWLLATAPALANSYQMIGGKCMFCCCTPRACTQSSNAGNCGSAGSAAAHGNVLQAEPKTDGKKPPRQKNGQTENSEGRASDH